MNVHISSCRLGTTTNIFDKHVYRCRLLHNYHTEPYFEIYFYMQISDENNLLTYESYLHSRGFDTMNLPH